MDLLHPHICAVGTVRLDCDNFLGVNWHLCAGTSEGRRRLEETEHEGFRPVSEGKSPDPHYNVHSHFPLHAVDPSRRRVHRREPDGHLLRPGGPFPIPGLVDVPLRVLMEPLGLQHAKSPVPAGGRRSSAGDASPVAEEEGAASSGGREGEGEEEGSDEDAEEAGPY